MFTKQDLELIEALCNFQIAQFLRMKDDRVKEAMNAVENLLEKVRKL